MSNTTNQPLKTRLDYLEAQFDPGSGPFVYKDGKEMLDNSGIHFIEKLCPCPGSSSTLCPCEPTFMLFDPKNDGDVYFTNGFNNIPVPIIPTTIAGLDRYIVPFDQFTDEIGNFHVKIYKNNNSISLLSSET